MCKTPFPRREDVERYVGTHTDVERVEDVPGVEAIYPAERRHLAIRPGTVRPLSGERPLHTTSGGGEIDFVANSPAQSRQERAREEVGVVYWAAVADEIAEERPWLVCGLWHVREEEPTGGIGMLDQVIAVEPLSGVEQCVPSPYGRDGARRVALIKKDPRLRWELVTPRVVGEVW